MVETTDTLNIMTWNIKAGGFDGYDTTSINCDREAAILTDINDAVQDHDVDTVSLPDAHRWDEVYGGNDGIARHLGFESAYFVRIEDERLNQDAGVGIGIAFATDKLVQGYDKVDLDTRQGLRAMLNVGKYGVQIASVYLDDLSDTKRADSSRALLANLEPDVPTLLHGDFNALRPNVASAKLSTRAKNVGVKTMAALLNKNTKLGRASMAVGRKLAPNIDQLGLTVCGMDERTVVPIIEAAGYTDADVTLKRPTALGPLHWFGVDYIFYKNGIRVDTPAITKNLKASDHSRVSTTCYIP